jgi:hypothetical protein
MPDVHRREHAPLPENRGRHGTELVPREADDAEDELLTGEMAAIGIRQTFRGNPRTVSPSAATMKT